eukprot:g5563.t1
MTFSFGTITTLLRPKTKGGVWRVLSRGSTWCVSFSEKEKSPTHSPSTWITAAHVVHPHKYLSHFPNEASWLRLIENRDLAALLEFRDDSGNVITGAAFCPNSVRCHEAHDVATVSLLHEEDSLSRMRKAGIEVEPLRIYEKNSKIGKGHEVKCVGHVDNNLENEENMSPNEGLFSTQSYSGIVTGVGVYPIGGDRADVDMVDYRGNLLHVQSEKTISVGFSGGAILSKECGSVLGLIQSVANTEESSIIQAISYTDLEDFVNQYKEI